MRRFVLRLLAFVRFNKAEADLRREIDAHLQLLEDAYRARGLSPAAAREAARRAFGGQVEQTKERQRDERSFRWLSGWSRDLRFGARMAARHPGLTLIAIFALSVAIGAGAGYFEFIQKLFRGTLPVADGHRIVGIYNWDAARGESDHEALHDFMAWRDTLQSIDTLAALRTVDRNVMASDGRIEPVRAVEVSAAAFDMLRVPPLLGRPLSADDERPGAADVAVIGYRLWHARFDGDPAAVGQAVSIGGIPHVVVGVMPDGFTFPINQSLWLPLKAATAPVRPGDGPAIRMVGRLSPGSTIEAARAELAAIGRRAEVEFPDTHRHLRPTVEPFVVSIWASQADGYLQMTLLDTANLLFLLLLVVCAANVATLVFARVITREGEISVRTALGASRGRIVAQLFAEALVLASIAAAIGLAGATFGSAASGPPRS
jgi:putative ABC transport system permease protein